MIDKFSFRFVQPTVSLTGWDHINDYHIYWSGWGCRSDDNSEDTTQSGVSRPIRDSFIYPS